jgi:hypothetical protein
VELQADRGRTGGGGLWRGYGQLVALGWPCCGAAPSYCAAAVGDGIGMAGAAQGGGALTAP